MMHREHTYLRILVSRIMLVFPTQNLEKNDDVSIPLGILNMLIGWNTVRQKMLPIVFIAIYLNQIQVIKEMVIILLVTGPLIRKKKERNLILMLEATIVFVTKLGVSSKH